MNNPRHGTGIVLFSLKLLQKCAVIVGVGRIYQQDFLNNFSCFTFLAFFDKELADGVQLGNGFLSLPGLLILICQSATQYNPVFVLFDQILQEMGWLVLSCLCFPGKRDSFPIHRLPEVAVPYAG